MLLQTYSTPSDTELLSCKILYNRRDGNTLLETSIAISWHWWAINQKSWHLLIYIVSYHKREHLCIHKLRFKYLLFYQLEQKLLLVHYCGNGVRDEFETHLHGKKIEEECLRNTSRLQDHNIYIYIYIYIRYIYIY